MSKQFGTVVTAGIAKQIAGNIREAILKQHIGIDERLPTETELANQFQVSRPTIREALKRLAAENLIRSRRGPAGGNFVKRPSVQEVQQSLANSMMLLVSIRDFSHDDVIETRLTMESACCELAARYRTEEQLAEMRREIELQDNTEIGDAEFCASDVRFHLTIAQASQSPILSLLTSALLESLQPVTNLIVFRFRDRKRIVGQHRKILKALELNDPAMAIETLTTQMSYLKKKYVEAREWRLNDTEKRKPFRVEPLE
jgi:GntR family transcriptional regulator, transcriptional repressor for pyruvate dehydrogenase complex